MMELALRLATAGLPFSIPQSAARSQCIRFAGAMSLSLTARFTIICRCAKNSKHAAPRPGRNIGHRDLARLFHRLGRRGSAQKGGRHVCACLVGSRGAALDAGTRPFRREATLLRLYRTGWGDDFRIWFGIKGAARPSGFPQFDHSRRLALFLRFSYIPAPYSIYENIFKVEPGSILTIAPDQIGTRERTVESYWRYEDVAIAGLANPVVDEREGLELLEQALRQAVALQLIADVPVTLFFRAGSNSSTIVALMRAQSSQKVKTFTVGFDETGFDEAPNAAAVARHLGTEHCEIRVTPSETRAVIPNLPTMYDEPFGDSSQIPTSIICAVARRSVTVALSGDGGDEMLGGYNRYTLGPELARRIAMVRLFLPPSF